MGPLGRVGAAWVSVLVTFALAGAWTTAASAEAPEFGRCLKKGEVGGIGFSDSKCTKGAEGSKAKWEWSPGAVSGKNAFTISGGSLTWVTTGGKSISCTGSTAEGEYSLTNSKRWEHVLLRLSNCKLAGASNCFTEGDPSGDLVFNELTGEVGYEAVATKDTAINLYPGPSAGGKFIEFRCPPVVVKVRGKGGETSAGILVPIPNDTMKSTYSLIYKATKGVQKPVSWEGVPGETYLEEEIESLGYEQAGWTTTLTVTNNEGMEYELNFFV
jgi:hypothetical protein